MKAKVEREVRIVQMASDFLLPKRVWIIHAPTYYVSLSSKVSREQLTIDPGHPAADSSMTEVGDGKGLT
jgi:hypothetical protein